MNSTEQKAVALSRAQAVREGQLRLQTALKSREISLADALEDPDAKGIVWWKLVRMLPRWSDARVMNLAIELAQTGVPIDPSRRVRMLTVRQRLKLIEMVGRPEPRERKTAPVKTKAQRSDAPKLTLDRKPGLQCDRCDIPLRGPAPNGLCGFCIAEEREIAA